jgi:hypothetical protein
MPIAKSTQSSGNSRKGATVPLAQKRRFTRTQCRVAAIIKPVDADVRLTGTIGDISPAGCYVEMLAPLPTGTRVEITVNTSGSNFQCVGTVRNCTPGMGMGVRFDRFTTDQLKKLKSIIPEIPEVPSGVLDAPAAPAAKGAPTKAVPARPSRSTNATEVLEAMVRVLLRKRLITREELVAEIGKGRAGKR